MHALNICLHRPPPIAQTPEGGKKKNKDDPDSIKKTRNAKRTVADADLDEGRTNLKKSAAGEAGAGKNAMEAEPQPQKKVTSSPVFCLLCPCGKSTITLFDLILSDSTLLT